MSCDNVSTQMFGSASSRFRSKMSGQEINVVIDAGSLLSKVGFAGETSPRAVFPTVTGRFRRPGLVDGYPLVYCGNEAILKRGISLLTWPVQSGVIQDWDEMEKLWHHVFYKELHVPPEETMILHAVHPLVSKSDREKMAEILFEAFAINGLNLVKSPILALHASGRTTGLTLEIGHSCCHAVPVFEGFPLTSATVTSPLNGEIVTNRLQKLLSETGYSLTTAAERDILNSIKEEKCFVARNFEEEIRLGTCSGDKKTEYKLPDGQILMLGEERFRSCEVLFNPSLEDQKCQNIGEIICQSISMTDLEYKALFYKNIVVAGGISMIPGLIERLKVEIGLKMVAEEWKPNVESLPSRQYQVWAGGSIMASLPCLKDFYMTKEEYDDIGPERVNYKFF